jgi:hypothetical protein
LQRCLPVFVANILGSCAGVLAVTNAAFFIGLVIVAQIEKVCIVVAE